MRPADLLEIVAVAAIGAVVVGALGLLVVRLTRRWSLRWQLGVVAATAVLAAYAGVLAIGLRMFLSHHDLTVMTVVSSIAAVVAIVVGVSVGNAITRWSTALRSEVRAMAGGAVVSPEPATDSPLELRSLAEELATTRQRLEEARARERQLEDARRELVSWVSHDLRTPLAGLRAMAEALEDGLAPDPARYHRRIRADVDKLAAMVDDLFELSRIHAGVLTLATEPVCVGDLVSEALAVADPMARAHGVHLGGHVDDDIEVTADPGRLSRVLSNLLMNAIRHTPADGTVEIRGRVVDTGVELSVNDGCGGIDPTEMARVFDLAWQGSPARTPADGLGAGTAGPTVGQGAGLGLAIVKGIVEAHRGTVWVENPTGAAGCSFRVLLPA